MTSGKRSHKEWSYYRAADKDDKKPLEEKVSDWLNEEGYRIEYLTWKAFQDVHLNATMSTFLESKEGKPREIDVTGFSLMEDGPIIVRVVCECKYSKLPWVLLYSDRPANLQIDWDLLPHSQSITKFGPLVQEERHNLEQVWHFSPQMSFAHTVVESMKKDNRDFAYNSIQKIANAAWDWAEVADDKEAKLYSVVIPCIVVDAPLLRAAFNYNAGRFESHKIPFGRLSWSGCRGGTLVDVVQTNSLRQYAKTLNATMQTIGEVIWSGYYDLINRQQQAGFGD